MAKSGCRTPHRAPRGELDIECLGASPAALQYNAQVYTGPPTTPPVTSPVSPTPDVFTDGLPFVPSQHFHLMTLPQNVLLTIWASSSAAWAVRGLLR